MNEHEDVITLVPPLSILIMAVFVYGALNVLIDLGWIIVYLYKVIKSK